MLIYLCELPCEYDLSTLWMSISIAHTNKMAGNNANAEGFYVPYPEVDSMSHLIINSPGK